MITTYKQTQIHYIMFGKGQVNIFLHGWGGSTDSFFELAKHIPGKNILIDFPPFGKSQEPSTPFNIFDYANIVKTIIEKENIIPTNIISHSFGTRVAICVCNMYNINKLVITGGAGLKPHNALKRKIRQIKYKIIKFFNKNAQIGSKDYKFLSNVMKKTFVNIVNFDVSNLAKNINSRTLLVYGNKDKETPLYMAKKFNKLIKNSKLIVYKNCGHFAYLENFTQFLIDVKTFIKD